MAVARIARVKTCKQCGIEYQWISGERGDLRGSCSLACRKARESERQSAKRAEGYRPPSRVPKFRKPPTPCQECGTPTTRPRFCCVPCSWRARDRRKGVRPLEKANAERAASAIRRGCAVCGVQFRPTRWGNHRNGEQTCCSRECSAQRKRSQTARHYDYPRANACDQCGRCVSLRAKYCSACSPWVQPNRCRDCGVEVSKGAQRCEPCRKKAVAASKAKAKANPAYRVRKRAAKAARRALERAAEADRFDPFEVFERDGWRCHMCGCSTPKRYRGTYRPNAPELDHIVPLAKGGQHTKVNTACSCRACNGAKSDRILGQPSLFSVAA